jgi:transcriptional regulator with XRE-family HTH domain
MSTLSERIRQSLERAKVSQARAAKELHISPAAVSKLLSGDSANMKAENVFRLAELCRVDPKWLATGHGHAQPKITDELAGISEARLDLLRQYGRLPKDIQFQIRGLISTLAAASSDRYAKWSSEEAVRAKKRDAAHAEQDET